MMRLGAPAVDCSCDPPFKIDLLPVSGRTARLLAGMSDGLILVREILPLKLISLPVSGRTARLLAGISDGFLHDEVGGLQQLNATTPQLNLQDQLLSALSDTPGSINFF